MKELLLEAFGIVDIINNEIYDQIGEQDFYCGLEVKTNGSNGAIVIEFGSYCLWDSEEDERTWISNDTVDGFNPEGDECQEPLEPFIRKELNIFLNILRKIKI